MSRNQSANEGSQIAVSGVKGRPMLIWVGKRPLRHVTVFPAQHIETFAPAANRNAVEQPDHIWQDWPKAYPKGGLLFHGDNKEVLAHLLANGFRGRVNLIYIDPPFDSGADYVRKVQLRGVSGTAKIEGESYSLGEQIQYTDIWTNDNYLQFMYERLILMKELLAEDGSIWLHCDSRRNYHLRCLMDEVFGAEHFSNEVIREKQRGGKHHVKKALGSIHDTIFHYGRGDDVTWHHIRREVPERVLLERYPHEDEKGRYALADCRNFSGVDRPNLTYEFLGFHGTWKWTHEEMLRKFETGEVIQTSEGNVPRRKVRPSEDGDLIQSLWYDVPDSNGSKDYPTEKSEELLDRIIRLTTNPGDLVLDCFIGSGTACAVAQRLGRRWIACDINKGAIQTTSRRLQTIIHDQLKELGKPRQLNTHPAADAPREPAPAQLAFTVHRVNDYDLAIQHNEAVNLACEHIGIERTHADGFFDGVLDRKLAKIIPLGHPLSPLDLEEVKRELEARPDEDRGVVLVCLGKELAADAWLEDWNRLRKGKKAVNRIEVIELRTDARFGKFFAHQPASARVTIKWEQEKLQIDVEDFISPSILQRLALDGSLARVKITDWRSMVDCVLIDTDFDGKVFNVVLSDVPQKKNDLVRGAYTLRYAPTGSTTNRTVAVKIIDMLGEEVLVTQPVG